MARKLQIQGWDVGRTVLTKIEIQRRCITDYELIAITRVLGVTLNDLVPSEAPELRGFFSQT